MEALNWRVLLAFAFVFWPQLNVQAQSIEAFNLANAQSFCLYVSIQSSATGIEGRSDELRNHLLRQATLYGVPVEDCEFTTSLEKPVISVVALAVPNGLAVSASVEVDVLRVGDDVILRSVSIWDKLHLGTGATDFERLRDNAQRLFEEIVIEWREVSGR